MTKKFIDEKGRGYKGMFVSMPCKYCNVKYVEILLKVSSYTETDYFSKNKFANMMKNVFITGASSGIGKATALYFAKKNWQVAATMRHPENEKELLNYSNIRLFRLDVTQTESIENALNEAIAIFKTIDVLVNNAGYGAVGIFEKANPEQIQRQFDTNVFGLMNVTRLFLPLFRKQKSGTIINISSVGGRITFPVYSVYHATKWAVEGFSESLQYELRPYNIRIKLVEPGAIKTDFYSRSKDVFRKAGLENYTDYEKIAFTNADKFGQKAPGPNTVAKTIYKAALNHSKKLRYPSGTDAKALLTLRKLIPNSWFCALIRRVIEKK